MPPRRVRRRKRVFDGSAARPEAGPGDAEWIGEATRRAGKLYYEGFADI